MVEAQAASTGRDAAVSLGELVVCSLEPWDEVWRRNQFFADALLRRNPGLRILFVEPAVDVLFELSRRRRPGRPGTRALLGGRLHALRPLKPLPRRAGALSDRILERQVLAAARRLRFTRPTLWLNDVNYAPLIARSGWPTVYDVTDDWLLAPEPPREIARLRALDERALADSREVVVCSPALAASRSQRRAGRPEREVTLVANGVDVAAFRRPRERPADLPPAPVLLYVGTLHEARLDIDLLVQLARALAPARVVLVGPDELGAAARQSLTAEPNIELLGARPYRDVPAYLQHAQVLLMPHRVTPFTESLDPIKLYEYAAVGVPTVSTPVAGFRAGGEVVAVVPRDTFVEAVRAALEASPSERATLDVPTWEERAAAFEAVLLRARAEGPPARPAVSGSG